MQLLMEKTEKFFCAEEDFAEKLIEERKESEDGMLIDYKLSVKELKNMTYYIVTLKTRYKTLEEAKEEI